MTAKRLDQMTTADFDAAAERRFIRDLDRYLSDFEDEEYEADLRPYREDIEDMDSYMAPDEDRYVPEAVYNAATAAEWAELDLMGDVSEHSWTL